jgi:cytochrome P450
MQSFVAINMIAVHYNPKIWKSPTAFDPTRFLKKETEGSEYIIGPNAYMPFGHGRRFTFCFYFCFYFYFYFYSYFYSYSYSY